MTNGAANSVPLTELQSNQRATPQVKSVAIIGCGFVDDLYTRSLATFPDFRVVAAYDRSPAPRGTGPRLPPRRGWHAWSETCVQPSIDCFEFILELKIGTAHEPD